MNDSTEELGGIVPPDINEVVAAKGADFLLGMDIPRAWATGVQLFAAPGTSMLVFREQNLIGNSASELQPAVKNVASLVLPTDVIRDLHRILGEQLAILDGANRSS